jgi:hypothetical protein
LFLDLANHKAGTVQSHVGPTAAVTTAVASGTGATGLTTVITLANAETASYYAHGASAFSTTLGTGAHLVADSTNTLASHTALASTATNGDAATRLLDIKAKLNAHVTQTGVHFTNDSVYVAVSLSTNATLAGNIALANSIQTKMNDHYTRGWTSEILSIVAP